MCKINGTNPNIQHYYNPKDQRTTLVMDPSNPTLGFSNSKISLNNGILNCFISRKKSVAATNYFDISTISYYILFASGNTKSNGRVFF